MRNIRIASKGLVHRALALGYVGFWATICFENPSFGTPSCGPFVDALRSYGECAQAVQDCEYCVGFWNSIISPHNFSPYLPWGDFTTRGTGCHVTFYDNPEVFVDLGGISNVPFVPWGSCGGNTQFF